MSGLEHCKAGIVPFESPDEAGENLRAAIVLRMHRLFESSRGVMRVAQSSRPTAHPEPRHDFNPPALALLSSKMFARVRRRNHEDHSVPRVATGVPKPK